MTWRLVDHTADVAIECAGASQGAVLADAATALTSVVTGRDDPRWWPAQTEVDLTVEAPDEEAAVVAWLSELLWLLEDQGVLWVTGGVEIKGAADGGYVVVASGNAVYYDPQVHGRGTEVKAVTYHDLAFEQKAGRWRLHVLLDI